MLPVELSEDSGHRFGEALEVEVLACKGKMSVDSSFFGIARFDEEPVDGVRIIWSGERKAEGADLCRDGIRSEHQGSAMSDRLDNGITKTFPGGGEDHKVCCGIGIVDRARSLASEHPSRSPSEEALEFPCVAVFRRSGEPIGCFEIFSQRDPGRDVLSRQCSGGLQHHDFVLGNIERLPSSGPAPRRRREVEAVVENMSSDPTFGKLDGMVMRNGDMTPCRIIGRSTTTCSVGAMPWKIMMVKQGATATKHLRYRFARRWVEG